MMAVTILVTMMMMTIMMMALNDHTLALFVDTYTLDTIRSVENDGDNDDGSDLSDTVGVNNLDSDKSVDDGSDDYYSDGGDEDDNDDDDGNDNTDMSDTISGN